jgi:hypothetical protein
MVIEMLKTHSEVCGTCDAYVLVIENLIENHFVPTTKYRCPASASAWDRWRRE